ncbi:MAG TPA: TetR/AcrR family transcriptional regulator [Rhodanobacteraceae bacterium]
MASGQTSHAPHNQPGRPREFDLDTAVDDAIGVFRERGYHATSISDLGAATGLTTGSLYKAFGDKRGVFLAAFDRYVSLRHAALRDVLDSQPNGREKVRAMLRFYAEASHGDEGCRGCLVVSSAMVLATLDAEMAARVEAAMRHAESLLRRLIRAGQGDGSIASDISVSATARALLAVLQGLRVIGKSGRSRRDMLAVADRALLLLG